MFLEELYTGIVLIFLVLPIVMTIEKWIFCISNSQELFSHEKSLSNEDRQSKRIDKVN